MRLFECICFAFKKNMNLGWAVRCSQGWNSMDLIASLQNLYVDALTTNVRYLEMGSLGNNYG